MIVKYVSNSLEGTDDSLMSEHPVLFTVELAAIAACAYHGYKRNDSVGWAIWWGLMGAIAPIIATPVAFAQGFAEPAKS